MTVVMSFAYCCCKSGLLVYFHRCLCLNPYKRYCLHIFCKKLTLVLSAHPPECAAILNSILFWPPTNLSVDFHFPFLSILRPPNLWPLFVSVTGWGNINMFVILYKHIFQAPFEWAVSEQQTDSQKLRKTMFCPANNDGGMKPYTPTWLPDLQETVANINCIYMYVWSVTNSDSPAHNLRGIVGWWQLLTQSHTQNTLVCSCGSVHAHLFEQTEEKLSCIGSDEDRTNSLPN